MGMNVDSAQVLQQADPTAQESLVTENEPDPMDAEQTWPTEEEMGMYQEDMEENTSEGAVPKKTRRVPKGTSSYQAAWIVDEESEGGDDQQEEDYQGEDDFMMDAAQEVPEEEHEASVAGDVSDEEYEEIELEDKETAFDATVNEEHEEEALKEYLDRKKKSQEDMQFPDEVDTPQHTPARVRFQKYRGLKSFRTSPWDPYEHRLNGLAKSLVDIREKLVSALSLSSRTRFGEDVYFTDDYTTTSPRKLPYLLHNLTL